MMRGGVSRRSAPSSVSGDPASPAKIQQRFNPGDNLHMNDAGYQAMADAINLGLFTHK